jgi:hypothetical protein
MYGNFSEDSLSHYQEILQYLEDPSLEFEEGDTYDFTRCVRPNGTAYGTRGACQAPNKVAPKQDVSLMNQKDFESGGGLSAVKKGLSSTQVVNRGRDARARAFGFGGGTSAMGKSGLSRDQIVQRGAQARAAAIKAGGGVKPGSSARKADQAARRGAQARAAAFKAGGGESSLKKGENREDIIRRGAASLKAAYEAGGGRKKYDETPEGYGKADVIAQGKKNLKAAFEAGGGEGARSKGMSIKDIIAKGNKALKDAYIAGGGDVARAKLKDKKQVIAKGKKSLQEAAKAGGGSVARGKKALADPVNETKRSLTEAGGGTAAIQKLGEKFAKRVGRKLTDKDYNVLAKLVEKRGKAVLSKYFEDGGGKKALVSGKSVDDIINIGEKIAKDKARKAKEQRARNLRSQIDRESQSV